ncbi:hypothetical protein [Pelomonas cellulosilytica]|uniref:Uncharacterized protein n=1 Tax=Pelomonas cellulosilytica TaxID=2906762 RepID=A0ABS8XYS1_9BURK|nr:hypothetical protein [Pelomonas sp. P8]MCE4555931.1 hypothetical protein [Pelomonas sp. P8]
MALADGVHPPSNEAAMNGSEGHQAEVVETAPAQMANVPDGTQVLTDAGGQVMQVIATGMAEVAGGLAGAIAGALAAPLTLAATHAAPDEPDADEVGAMAPDERDPATDARAAQALAADSPAPGEQLTPVSEAIQALNATADPDR